MYYHKRTEDVGIICLRISRVEVDRCCLCITYKKYIFLSFIRTLVKNKRDVTFVHLNFLNKILTNCFYRRAIQLTEKRYNNEF